MAGTAELVLVGGAAGEVAAVTGELSPLAAAYGQVWDVLRGDTERVLVDVFHADRGLVEAAGTEWFDAHPEWVDHPPPHLRREAR